MSMQANDVHPVCVDAFWHFIYVMPTMLIAFAELRDGVANPPINAPWWVRGRQLLQSVSSTSHENSGFVLVLTAVNGR